MTAKHIQDSIARAVAGESHCAPSTPDLRYGISPTMRRLLGNLLHDQGPLRYLEAGCYFGGSACAAIFHNPNVEAYLFESGQEPYQGIPIVPELIKNLAAHQCRGYNLIIRDFFEPIPQIFTGPIDVFFYDAVHSQEGHAAALPHIFDHLADRFVFLVDDYHWDAVAQGTEDGFWTLDGRVRVRQDWRMSGEQPENDPIWANGMAIFLCEKT